MNILGTSVLFFVAEAEAGWDRPWKLSHAIRGILSNPWLKPEVYRNYCATVLLSEPWDYSGGELEFFNGWGDKDAQLHIRPSAGDAWLFCGCQHSFHAVQGGGIQRGMCRKLGP